MGPYLRNGIVWMQALQMTYLDGESGIATLERPMNPAGRVLDKHQVLAISPREGLFIRALDRRLDRRAQSGLDSVDQLSEPQARSGLI